MKEILLDVVNHLIGIAAIEMARITGDEHETTIDAIDEKRSVVLKGRLHQPHDQLTGEFGIGRLSTLKGLLNFSNFKTDDASISVTRNTRNGTDVPEELFFSNKTTGNTANYRFNHPESLPPKAHFKNVEWDVVITPTASKIQEFTQLSSIVSGVENFLVKTENGNLVFYLGDALGTNDKVSIVFSANIDGKLTSTCAWPVVQVLQIFKLAEANDLKVKISDKGAMMISMETEYASYEYILPARQI